MVNALCVSGFLPGYHPQPGATGFAIKSLRYLEQSVAIGSCPVK